VANARTHVRKRASTCGAGKREKRGGGRHLGRTRAHAQARTQTGTQASTRTRTHTHAQARTQTHARSHTHTHTHTHTQTHTHTHTHTVMTPAHAHTSAPARAATRAATPRRHRPQHPQRSARAPLPQVCCAPRTCAGARGCAGGGPAVDPRCPRHQWWGGRLCAGCACARCQAAARCTAPPSAGVGALVRTPWVAMRGPRCPAAHAPLLHGHHACPCWGWLGLPPCEAT
jgi:hypothetical protein